MLKVLFGSLILATTTLPAFAGESLWNGHWVLSPARNTQEIKDQAANDYTFTIGEDGPIKWEIPSLGEVVVGRTDGQPMEIHRPGVPPGLTLSVEAEGPRVLLYKVAKDGVPKGQGRMTLIEDGKAWVDISWPYGQPQYAGVVIYVRS